ncbi:MAG: Hsp20/alpha crystallin family protein [bacterium]|nr:Hsp20/alpha crystallin family protein [bacterium]
MTLVRWFPRRDLLTIQNEMNRLFENFFGSSKFDEAEPMWSPRMDVIESKDDYIVKADIPGVRKEDVKITLNENVLTVQGERAEEVKKDSDTYHLIERRVGKFSRSLTLPTNVVVEKIKAKFNDGVLTITLPKAEEAKPREISIESN